MADFKISRLKYTWKGQWSSGTEYLNDDIVSVGPKIYVCIAQHTANTDFYIDLNFLDNSIPPQPDPRWELMTTGVTWNGDWNPDHYYVEGSLVRKNGIIYLCVEAHTSTSLETDFEDDLVTNEYWTVYVSSQEWRITWTPSTSYSQGDIVRYSGVIYRCRQAHVSADNAELGLDFDLSKWDEVIITNYWRGDWSTNTLYFEYDIVKYGGTIYECIGQHTSSDTTADGLEDSTSVKWRIVHSGLEYIGNWTQDQKYRVNDLVKYGSYLYKCIQSHIVNNVDLFDSSKWQIFCPGFEFDAVWNVSTVYQPGDIVRQGGFLFTAVNTSVGSPPAPANSNWQILFENTRVRGEWSRSADYQTGDLVRRQGQLYIAKDNLIAGTDTDIADDNSTIDTENWELLIPGVQWQGQWEANRTYVIGDIVLWKSGGYKCVGKHYSVFGSRPGDEGGLYWEKFTYSDENNVLTFTGDIKTYGIAEDGSTIGPTRLAIGNQGQALMTDGITADWNNFNENDKVYYVAPTGADTITSGTTLNSPWKTLRYALENITGPATVHLKTGFYEEILPLSVPANVAVVGDELRGAVVKPAENYFSNQDVTSYSLAMDYLNSIVEYIILEQPIGTTDPGSPAFGSSTYGDILQNFSGTPATSSQVLIARGLLQQIKNRLLGGGAITITSTNTISPDTERLNAAQQLLNNETFIIEEVRGFLFNFNPSYDFLESFDADIHRIVKALIYDLRYPGNYKSQTVGTYFQNGSDYDLNKTSNMFLMRDGTGLRNCTLMGLDGELGPLNEFLTRRPTAGAFVSLDPGWGPNDSTAWVGTRSPYIQNVTNFGRGCVGFKIDGDLHVGGNKTMVSNDFTQILSDGIGVWCNGQGKSECVSVFTYYNHIGYLCTDGGKIRGTNGNCSYGQYGAVAERFDLNETPITAKVNNRYYDATVDKVFSIDGKISKLFYSHAGNEYTTASGTLGGSGINAQLIFDDIRDGAVNEVRIKDPGDSSVVGGGGYVQVINVAQAGGNQYSITIAGSDINEDETYRGMRIIIENGTGSGQYGYVAEYDSTTKTVWVGDDFSNPTSVTATTSSGNRLTVGNVTGLAVDEPIIFTGTKFGNIQDKTVYWIKTIVGNQITVSTSLGGPTFLLVNGTGTMVLHHLGWNHLIPGTTLVSIFDTTTSYSIEPRVTFSAPGFGSQAFTMSSSQVWKSVIYGGGRFVAIADGNGAGSTAIAYSTNGTAWTSVNTLNKIWSKLAYGDGKYIAVADDGTMVSSTNASLWTVVSGAPVLRYTSIAYGGGKWVAIASGTTQVAHSVDGVTWLTATLPEGADWIDVSYGKGRFVAVAESDSSVTNSVYSTDGGVSWSLGSFAGGCKAIAYGNNRFVAIEGGTGSANAAFVSLDGISWQVVAIPAANYQYVTYGAGLFVAIADNSANILTSVDGLKWNTEILSASGRWRSIAFGNPSSSGKFIIVAGATPTATGNVVTTGVTAQGRVSLASGRINMISVWDVGSGYSSPPIVTVTDPNNIFEATTVVRIGNGVLAQPTIINGGEGWATLSTTLTITGDGYKDQYQIGRNLVVSELTRLPSPGDNLYIDGIDDYTYKVLDITVLAGTVGNFTARLGIAKTLKTDETPEHLTELIIRQLYSQVRLTGHDFLDIGLGNFEETNYPNTLFPNGTVLAPEDEIREAAGGRCFYSSTDQDGNFRVGELFAVEQATGTVTISADFFVLEGLEELSLGGVSVGGSGVVVREFSADPLFTADSNNIIPTQKAIKSYLSRRVSGGGADAFTASLVAGTVRVGPTSIDTTTGDTLQIPVKVNFLQPMEGDMLNQAFFLAGDILGFDTDEF